MLADIDAGLVDQIVVYKVDRLTRSLSDFAKLVDRLDAASTGFVSVTQSFNTATSMGRLTLHMLLSFAQFEREVTAERIRDKVAASKRKGLWMGGRVPLSYEKDERTLRINEAEAETVPRVEWPDLPGRGTRQRLSVRWQNLSVPHRHHKANHRNPLVRTTLFRSDAQAQGLT